MKQSLPLALMLLVVSSAAFADWVVNDSVRARDIRVSGTGVVIDASGTGQVGNIRLISSSEVSATRFAGSGVSLTGVAHRPPGYTSGYWYPGFPYAAATTTGSFVSGTQYFSPITVDESVTIAAIALRTATTGSNTTAKAGIYASDAVTGSPTTLLASATTGVDVTTQGVRTFTLDSPVTLQPGLIYYGSHIISSTGTSPTFAALSLAGCSNVFFGLRGGTNPSNVIGTTGNCGFSASGANYTSGLSPSIPSGALSVGTRTMETFGIKVQ